MTGFGSPAVEPARLNANEMSEAFQALCRHDEPKDSQPELGLEATAVKRSRSDWLDGFERRNTWWNRRLCSSGEL